MALTKDQVRILAQTLLGEAGGEGLDGMKAVAHVIKNRASDGRFPNDPVSVAMQPQQFSTWNEGQGGNNPGRFGPGSPGYEDAVKAVEAVFNGNDPDSTGGATHYWSPRGMQAMGYAPDPYWARSEETEFGRKQIGNHVFLPRENPALAAIENATAPVPMPAPDRMAYRGDAPVPMPPNMAVPGRAKALVRENVPAPQQEPFRVPPPPNLVADSFAALPQPSPLRATDPVASDLIPELRVPYAKSALTDVGRAVPTPEGPLANFAYTLPDDMTPPAPPPPPIPAPWPGDRAAMQPAPVELPQTGTGNFGDPARSATPLEIESGSGFRVADRGAPPDRLPAGEPGMPFDYDMPAIVPMPRPRPSTGLQTGIAPPGFTPYPARQQRAFGDAPTLPGRLGLLQTMAGSALNPSGPERRQVNNTMTSIFNPGVQSSQAVRDEARRTGNHSTLQRGDRRYDPDTNEWRVK